MPPLVIQQNASIPIAINLVDRLNRSPIENPGGGAKASLLINFPDGTSHLITNLPRYTVSTSATVGVEGPTVTLNTLGGGTPIGPLTYTTTASETPTQIAAGIAALVNESLPTGWTCAADGADLVFASPESGDSVAFAASAHVTFAQNPSLPTVAWTNSQLLFTPPQGCFAVPGSGTWNAFLDLPGSPAEHVPSMTGDFRVIAPGSHDY